MGLPRLVRAFEAGFEGPLEVCAALGHGRSFGIWTRILHRSLPGITDCGLWPALDAHDSQADETLALITDVGNDLLYGVDAPQIAEWVEDCVTRLNRIGAQIVLTGLPMDNVEQLKAWRYYSTRALFFPRSQVTFEQMQKRARELHRRLHEIGERHGATMVGLPGEWYSLDPIHFRHLRRSAAWQTLLSAWRSFPPETPTGMASPFLWGQLARAQPILRKVFGNEQATSQPAFRRGRVSVSLY
jgi:hypothetical protein